MKTLDQILTILRTSDYSHYYTDKPSFRGGKQSGSITYIPWYAFPQILDDACDGQWEWDLTPSFIGDMAVVTGKLTIIGSDGRLTRTAIGNEQSDCDGYGDATSNASAMALRRAMSLFGVGLELWAKGKVKPSNQQVRPSNQQVRETVPATSGTLTREQWQAKFGNKN